MDLELIKTVFNKYISTFDTNNYDIKYKFTHSYRVMELCKELALNYNLTQKEVELCTVIGLLHDIGRFEQIKNYNSMIDKTIDHADLGVKILFEDNLIQNFNIDKKYYEIIKFAIKNHNKLDIEFDKNDEKIFYASVIRDADKIDILRAFSIYKEYKTKEVADKITEEVKKSFFRNESIKKKDIKSKNDVIILRLAFLFDMNFSESLSIIDNEKILEYYEQYICTQEMFKPYLEHAKKYMKERKRYVR